MKRNLVNHHAEGNTCEAGAKSLVALCFLISVAPILGGCAGEYNVSTANGPSYPVPPDYSLQGPAAIGDPGFAADLGGRCFHDGRPTSIEIAPDRRNLTIINEWG